MSESENAGPSSATPVQSLVRGLAVIRVFDADNAQLTLSDVARRAELTRATARRVLHTLADLGYVSTRRPPVQPPPEDPRARTCVPVVDAVAVDRPTPSGATHRVRSRVVVRRGARRTRHRLRRQSGEAAHHDRLDQRRHPIPRLRHVHGPRHAGEPADRRSSTTTSTATSARRSRHTPSPIGASWSRSSARSAIRAGHSSTRSWRRGCDPSPRPSATAPGSSSQRSTCQPAHAAAKRPRWSITCCPCCWRRRPRSTTTCASSRFRTERQARVVLGERRRRGAGRLGETQLRELELGIEVVAMTMQHRGHPPREVGAAPDPMQR